MKDMIKILIGLLMLVIPLYLIFPGSCMYSWGVAALNLLKGGIVILIFAVGIITIVIGINDLKENHNSN
ncbi:hypothetical protein B6U91_00090 [Candidatus Pacearchaeota archaeon ex4484_71]|nr:MAG: hypothetical protein B6U91_00090 [Candidatus Pacearchaeota archaeon ex4484_71]